MRRRNCPVEMVGSGKVTRQAVLTNLRKPESLGLSVTGLIKTLLLGAIWLGLTGTASSYQTEAFLTGGQGPAPVQTVVQPPATVGFGPTPTPSPALQGPAVEQSAAPDPWTLEAIQSRLAQLELNTELEPKLKTSLIELYKQIENEVKALADFEKLRRDWTSAAEQAPLAIASAKERLQMSKMAAERAANLPPNSFNLGIELSELERQLQAMQSELQVVATQRTKADETINQRDKRRKDFPNLLAALRERIDVFNREQATPPIDNVDPVLREAEVVLKRFQRERVMAELAAMEQEQRAYDAESELWPTRRDEAEQRSNQLQAEIQRLSDVISKRRTLGIELALAEAEMLKEGAPPALHAMADRLLERAQRWLELTRKRASLQQDIASTKSDFEQWNERFQRMDARIKPQSGPDLGGFNSWVGLMLREQRKDLPDPISLRGQIRKHQNEMQLADSLIFDLEDRRANLLAVQRDRQLLYKEITSDLQNEVSDDVLVQTQDMLEKESKILTGMRSEADAYYNDLLQLADGKERLARLSEQYRNFIDQHILWIRSSENLDKSDFRNAWQAFQYFVDYHNWLVVIEFLLADFKTQPWWYVLVAACVIALIVYQSSMRRQLIAMQEQVNKRANVSFTPTFKAFLLTVLVSAPFPLLLVFLGMRLLGASSEQTFVTSLGIGLLAGGRFLASLELLRQICRPNGLAIGHLHWPKAGTDLLRTHLRWWLDLGIPLVIGIVVFDELAASRRDESIGRMLFIVLMILLSIFLAQVFRLKGGILSTFLEENRGGWIDRLKLIWYPLMVITPISLAGLSFIGFHYTAERIALSLHTTMWTLVGLIVLHGLLMRWLLLSRRKLTLQQAKLRLEEAAKKDPQAIASSPVEEQVVDIAAINDQTRRLVTSSLFVIALIGVGFIWKSILPAVSLLDSVTLWTVDGVTSDDRVAITLANVVIAIPIVVLTVIASRNLPGLLEIALLQNLPLDKAMRYAITSISSYAILLLGVVVVLASLGLRWSSIQWLVAALGVGLGFGLQEIFANFVCGLIVLFEQPIRVGDVVTIGDTTGMVSRIRMRSTTIVNWDRKELIVPNKDLITGRILNWTLSDGTNRLVMSVGVAYGSDADLVFRLLQDLVKQHPQVLREPEATVTFEAFADSSLTFTIRAFVADVNVRLPTTHELHNSIYRVFAEHNISIAYPQRDLHIRTLPAEFFGQAIKHR